MLFKRNVKLSICYWRKYSLAFNIQQHRQSTASLPRTLVVFDGTHIRIQSPDSTSALRRVNFPNSATNMLKDNASRLLVPIVRSAIQTRSQSVISGPPTKHVSKGELYALGSTIVVSVITIPAWVLYHIREYRGK